MTAYEADNYVEENICHDSRRYAHEDTKGKSDDYEYIDIDTSHNVWVVVQGVEAWNGLANLKIATTDGSLQPFSGVEIVAGQSIVDVYIYTTAAVNPLV